jgi:SAM-dependent methyltransferase
MRAESPAPAELERIYRLRFDNAVAFRNRLWNVLATEFFQRYVRVTDAVLDLGCGYGEFINNIACGQKYAIDLNAATAPRLDRSVTFFHQDCSKTWPVNPGSLDVVFTSNFLEHLPSKVHVDDTLHQADTALRAGGRLILMGPNIRFLAEAYWDFWDHYIPISHVSLIEALRQQGFGIERAWPRFLPYTMAGRGRTSLSAAFIAASLRVYLRIPVVWRIFGRQFLIIATKPAKG